MVKGCYLHRQGISLSADAKTLIYFVIVCQNSHTLVREFYFFTKSVIEIENGKIYVIIRYRQIGI